MSKSHLKNLVVKLFDLEMRGYFDIMYLVQPEMYSSIKMKKRISSHYSSIMCVCLDRSGKRIYTGSSDSLLKEWFLNGDFLVTYRGHQDAITDIDVSYENTLLASSSFDQTIRIWNLETKQCIAILHEHSEVVTSVKFSPISHLEPRFLVSVGKDGFICFWEWKNNDFSFNQKPTKFQEKHQFYEELFPFSLSSCGRYLAVASEYNEIRTYFFGNWYLIRQDGLKGHEKRVECIKFANNSIQFASGSEDGMIKIWSLENEKWKSKIFEDSEKLNEKEEYDVNIYNVSWSCDDSLLITTDSENIIKVWETRTGILKQKMKYHSDQILSIEPNPNDSRLVLSAGIDGQIILWDILKGEQISNYYNKIDDEQNFNMVNKAIWSLTGLAFIAVNLNGFLIIFN
jgi:WD40 repeat protein